MERYIILFVNDAENYICVVGESSSVDEARILARDHWGTPLCWTFDRHLIVAVVDNDIYYRIAPTIPFNNDMGVFEIGK